MENTTLRSRPAAVRGRLPLEELAEDPRKLRRMILTLAWPVAAEMFLQTLTQIVDMVMVSRLGEVPVAAVGLSFRPLFFVMSIFLGVSAGTTALVARSIGSGDREEAQRITQQTVLATTAFAIVLSYVLYVLAPAIQQFMGASPEVLPYGVGYIRSLTWGLVFMHVSHVATAALRGGGDTQTSMKANVAGNALNVFLNWILIFGNLGFPRLGVVGAGIATSISRAVAASIILGLMFADRLVLSIPRRGLFRFAPATFVRVVRVGVPAATERILLSLAMVLHLKMLAVAGTTAVAAATLSQNIEEISHMPSIGLSASAATLVGQFLGDRRPDSAERSVWDSTKMALLFMGLMGLLFTLFPAVWLSIYAPEPDLLAVGSVLIRIMGISQPFMAVGFVLTGGLRGAGDTMSVMAISAISIWGVRLGLTLLFMNVFSWGPAGAWVAMVFDSIVRAVLAAWVFKKGTWKKVRI